MLLCLSSIIQWKYPLDIIYVVLDDPEMSVSLFFVSYTLHADSFTIVFGLKLHNTIELITSPAVLEAPKAICITLTRL